MPSHPLALPMEVIAHRGASFDCAGNTLAAFTLALARGSMCVETDVRACKDGSLVLCHDPVVPAVMGPGICIAEHGLSHIRSNAIGGADIMELDDLLALLGAAGCRIHMEIKPGPLQMDIVDEACLRMRRAGVEGMVSSFDPGIVVRAGKTGMQTLLLMETMPMDTVGRARRAGAGAVGVDIRALKVGRARSVAARIPLYCFTINTMVDFRKCLDAGVAGVYSDHPDLEEVLSGGAGRVAAGKSAGGQ